jgi:hypothetical protein
MTKQSTFRACVLMVFERLGLAMPAESYLADFESVNRAAAEWHAERGATMGPCRFNLPDPIFGGSCIVTGNLSQADRKGWLGNAAARDFVRFVDERSNRRGTLLMLQILLTIQMAMQPQPNARGGEA